jgi:hypothetical protein
LRLVVGQLLDQWKFGISLQYWNSMTFSCTRSQWSCFYSFCFCLCVHRRWYISTKNWSHLERFCTICMVRSVFFCCFCCFCVSFCFLLCDSLIIRLCVITLWLWLWFLLCNCDF